MINNRIIKHMVENYMRIENLSITSRKRVYVDSRAVYYKLCRKFSKNSSYEIIGQSVGRNHATAIHGENLFNNLYNTPGFEVMSEMYDSLSNQLMIMKGEPEQVCEIKLLQDAKRYYRAKLIQHIDKSHSVISTLNSKINLLTKNALVKKILSLEAEDIEELEIKLIPFFKMKEQNKKVFDS